MRLSSVTGVLHNPSREGNCYAAWRPKKQISSYFRALIAVLQNSLLLIGSRGSVTGASPMSDFSHEPERISTAGSLGARACDGAGGADRHRHRAARALVRATLMTTATTWNERAPKRADNVEIAPRISEDWLSLIIGLFIFVLALAGIVQCRSARLGRHHLGVDRPRQGARPRVEVLCFARRRRRAGCDLCRAARRAERGGGRAQERHQAIRARLHRGVLDRLCELDRRQLRQLRRGDAGRPAEVRHQLVAQADQRRRLYLRAASPAWSSPMCFRASPRRSRTRCGPSSTSRSRS